MFTHAVHTFHLLGQIACLYHKWEPCERRLHEACDLLWTINKLNEVYPAPTSSCFIICVPQIRGAANPSDARSLLPRQTLRWCYSTLHRALVAQHKVITRNAVWVLKPALLQPHAASELMMFINGTKQSPPDLLHRHRVPSPAPQILPYTTSERHTAHGAKYSALTVLGVASLILIFLSLMRKSAHFAFLGLKNTQVQRPPTRVRGKKGDGMVSCKWFV